MKMLTVGMSPRESAALSILVGVNLKGWSCDAATQAPGRALPVADLYVVDLAGVGLMRWSVHAEATLLQLLAGHSAVLLHSPSEVAWTQMQVGHQHAQVLAWLAKPYSSAAMRQALHDAVTPPKRSPSARMPVIQMRSDARAGAPVERPGQMHAARPPAPMGASLAPVSAAMTPGNIAALRDTFPQLGGHAFLAQLIDAVGTGHPQELRLSLQHSVVVHPHEGWIATNAPMNVLERICRRNELVQAVSVRPLTDAQAQERVQRLNAPREALDRFLWVLAVTALGQEPLREARDAQLTLKGFPDYTRLSAIPDFFIQLAAICVRLPQTLSGLQSAFPSSDPQEVRRFAFFCAASGLGQLSVAGPRAALVAPATLRKPHAQVKRGFFAAMLQKLF